MNSLANLDDITNLTDVDIMNIFDDINFDENNNEYKNDINKCMNCDTSEYIINDISGGMEICTNCGQVMNMLTDMGPETRHFDDDKNETKQSAIPINKLLPQSSLGTMIGGRCMGRIKILHAWSTMPYKERSLNAVFKEISYRCSKYNIPKCIEEDAKIMYKTVSECKHIMGKNKGKCIIIRGANRKSLIAACVFFACRRKGMTRSPKEIADIFEIKYTEMTKGCKNFMKLMKIKKMGINTGSSKPEDFITRFCKELKIKEPYLQQTLKIAKNIKKLNIASVHTPLSSATSSILLMAELNGMTHITKKKLALQFKVSEVTLTKTYKKLEQYKKALINDDLTDKLVQLIKEEETNEIIPDFIKNKCEEFNKIETNNDNTIDNDEELYYENEMELTEEDDVYELEDYDYMFDSNYKPIDYLQNKLLDCTINDDIIDILTEIDIEICNELNLVDQLYNDCINYA
jgi:transcription initiation factor TFIIIB Brf1 subunit/transcription initiation factor TFIIB